MSGPLFFILLMSTGVGATLLALGLQGKLLNDNPICRACGFDLVGATRGTERCPECGASLVASRAIRWGRRKRRKALIAAGVMLLLGPLGVGVAWGLTIGNSSLEQHLPLWALLWEGRHGNDSRSALAASEVLQRAVNRELDNTDRQRGVATALDIQADPRRTWDSKWGSLVERAKAVGELGSEDEARYHRNAVRLVWRSRAVVRAGEPLPVIADVAEVRLGPETQLTIGVSLKHVAIDSVPTVRAKQNIADLNGFSLGQFLPLGFITVDGQYQNGSAGLEIEVPANLGPGRHTCEVQVRTKPIKGDWNNPTDVLVYTGPEVAEHNGTFDFTLLPSGAEDVRTIASTAEMTAGLRASLGTPRITGGRLPDGRTSLMVIFDAGHLPAPLACDVLLKDNGETWELGAFTSGRAAASELGSAGSDSIFRIVSGTARDFDARRVDIVLRPNPEIARRTIDLTTVYGGEIEIPRVQVKLR